MRTEKETADLSSARPSGTSPGGPFKPSFRLSGIDLLLRSIHYERSVAEESAVSSSVPYQQKSGQLPEGWPECHPRYMKRDKRLAAIVGTVLACYTTAIAQENGNWRAASTTAQSITGDVALSADKIAINFSSFTIAQIRALQPAEANAAFEADTATGAGGSLYRLSIPGAKKFLHRNTLCGNEDIQWMATYVAARTLHLAFFSGSKMPVLTPDALANSTDLCGTFTYVR